MEIGKEVAMPPSERKIGKGFQLKFPERGKWKTPLREKLEMEMKRGIVFPLDDSLLYRSCGVKVKYG
ncbi:MAG: hypothetical protein HY200_04735 [Nitrospirae bacterium]|nr:hypothetical protein [Nitrospirota bacterium]